MRVLVSLVRWLDSCLMVCRLERFWVSNWKIWVWCILCRMFILCLVLLVWLVRLCFRLVWKLV